MRPIFCCLAVLGCAVTFARPPAGEIGFKTRGEGRSTFESTAEARQFSAEASAELVRIAKEQFGIHLDGSESSIVQLQRLAEAVYPQLKAQSITSDPDADRKRWIERFTGYYGELLVRHRGAYWGKTDWMGGEDRALGFPKSRNILLPAWHVQQVISHPSDVCGWYLIAITGEDNDPAPPKIKACSDRGWVKSPAELAADAARAAERKAAGDAEAQARTISRTKWEVQTKLSGAMYDTTRIFEKYGAKSPANVVVSFTIAPSGEVTEAHVVSSDAGDPRIEAELLAKVRAIRFEARDVPPHVTPGFIIRYATD